MLGRHHQVAGQREFGAAGQRLAVDGRDPGLAALAVDEARETAALGAQRAAAAGRDLLEVGAGAEGVRARAGQHHDPGVLVGLCRVDRGLEAGRDRAVDGVAGLGPVDGDDRDVAGEFLDAHRVVLLSCVHARLQRRLSVPAVTWPVLPTGDRSRSVSTASAASSSGSTRAISRSPAGVRAITMPCVGRPSRP